MDLRAYLSAIRKSWWIVIVAMILGAGAASLMIARATPVYAAHLTFYVGTTSTSGTTSGESVIQFAQDEATSLAEVVSQESVGTLIVSNQKLRLTGGQVASKISGAATINTVIINVTVKDTSPDQALAIATGLSNVFPGYVAKTLIPASAVSGTQVNITTTSGPGVSSTPVSPRKKLELALGIVLGLLIGLALAIVRHLLDTAVRLPSALVELTRRPVLGEITFDPDARSSPLFLDEANGLRRSEEFRHLRTSLSFLDAAEPIRVVVVTSALESEGKSSTAANLAVVSAETDARVLLIEADLRRPSVSNYLGLERGSGLTNVLAGQVEVDDVLQPWGERLTVLASGPVPPNPSELLGGRRMAELIARLRGEYDLIILDTPPLLPVTDAAVATAYADGVVLVVRYGHTKRGQVSAMMASLETANARVLGSVLSMRPSRGADSGNYGDYYSSDEDPEVEAEPSAAPAAAAAPKARGRWRRRRVQNWPDEHPDWVPPGSALGEGRPAAGSGRLSGEHEEIDAAEAERSAAKRRS